MRTLFVATVIALTAPAVTHAEAEGGNKSAKARYDPAKVVTVKGTVLGEQKVDTARGAKAVRLVLKVGDDQVSVHLGPDSWVDKQSLKFTRGDEITVKGSKFTYENKYGLIAQVITRGDASMVLRDGSGRPAWASK